MATSKLCNGCAGDCCSYYEIIQLLPDDIPRMAAYLEMSPPEFARLFVSPLPEGHEKEYSARGTYTCCLKRQDLEQPDGSMKSYCCFFFNHPTLGGRCAIHDEKPSACRVYSAKKCKLRRKLGEEEDES